MATKNKKGFKSKSPLKPDFIWQDGQD